MSNHKILYQVHVEVRKNAIHCKNDTIKRSNISRIWKGTYEKYYFIPNLFLMLLILACFYYGRLFFAATLLLGTLLAIAIHEVSLLRTKGIHIQLNSGFIYTFPVDGHEFAAQVLTILKTFLDDEEQEYTYQIDFRDNTIVQDVLIIPKILSTAVQETEAEALPVAEPDETVETSAATPTVETAASPLPDPSELLAIPASAVLLSANADPIQEELERLFQYYKESGGPNSDILLTIKDAQLSHQQHNLEKLTEIYHEFVKKELISGCNTLGLYHVVLQLRQLVYK